MSSSELLLYQTEDGQTRVQVRLEGETVWLSQRQLADLFQKSVPTINEHIQNIYEEGELQLTSTIRNFRIVQSEGGRDVEREIAFYNLDVIISVGYRVRSHRGTQFRIWATQRLREFIVKGFTLDDQRLKEGGWTDAYFDELLERVREIRTSERLFYKRSATSTPPVWTMIRTSLLPRPSSPLFRTSSTSPSTAIQRQN